MLCATYPQAIVVLWIKKYAALQKQEVLDASQRIVAELIYEYNHVRLHAALRYMEPRKVHFGNPENGREQRRQKIDMAQEQR
jgi:hypothetical protein